jgi:hypothetical protein
MNPSVHSIVEALVAHAELVGHEDALDEREVDYTAISEDIDDAKRWLAQKSAKTAGEAFRGTLERLGIIDQLDGRTQLQVRLALAQAYATSDVADAIRELAAKIST